MKKIRKTKKNKRVILYPAPKEFLVEMLAKNLAKNEGLDKWNEDCVNKWKEVAPRVQASKLTDEEIDTSINTLMKTHRGAHLMSCTVLPIVRKSYNDLLREERLFDAYNNVAEGSEDLGSLKTIQLYVNLAMSNISNHKEHLSDFSDCYDCLVIQNALNTRISRMEAVN